MGEAHHQRQRRLQTIEELELLGRAGDPVLTRLSRMARYVTGASASAVHIIGNELQHRIAASGVALTNIPVEHSMCRRVVETGEPIIYPDGSVYEHFRQLPGTTGPDGSIRFYAAVPLRVGDGSVVGTLCAFDQAPREIDPGQVEMLQELADLARAHLELVRVAAELGEAATTDSLTGAVNRTMFGDRVASALARRTRRGTDVLVVMLDVDDFKAVNDSHGHHSGDEALRWLADRVRGAIREQDTLGRLGGDEFAVLAEIVGSPVPLIDRLRIGFQQPEAPVTVTLGAAVARADDDVRSLLGTADAAMYEVKRLRQRGGRAAVTTALA